MKFILLLIGILLILFSSSLEGFAEVDERIFNEVEIPDSSKDPYYQVIKNIDFPCMCGEGKEKDSKNNCVQVCPPGQTRFTDDKCYLPCPQGQIRNTNGVCYPPCPIGEFRNPAGNCQCNSQQPLYDLSTNHDIRNYDLQCVENPGGGWPKWANDSKARCDNNPECKGYNLISIGGAWGDRWGSCMKNTTSTPTRVPLEQKIDYYRKIETARNNNGVCVTECPIGKTKDANGICQWNPCPTEQSRDAYGDCQLNPCPADQTRDGNGVCQCIQQPYYEKYPKLDVPGNDIKCIWDVPNLEGCKLECNKDPKCKAYNIIDGKHCCLKTTTNTPTESSNNIDYFKRVDAPLSKGTDGVCRPPCSYPDQIRDSNGICQCPVNKTKDTNGVCQWNPCTISNTVRNIYTGDCDCIIGYDRALGKKGNNDPCYKSCGAGAILDENAQCKCPPPLIGDGYGGCKLDNFTAMINDYRYLQLLGLAGSM